MKFHIIVEVDVSPTIAETIKRGGFTLCQDGSGQRVQVANSPAIPKRKTKVMFVEEPEKDFSEYAQSR